MTKKTPSIAEQVDAMVPQEPEPSEPEAPEQSPSPKPEPAPAPPVQPEGMGEMSPEVARVMAEMQQEITTLQQRVTKAESTAVGDPDDVDSGPGGFPWQYYKKPDVGPEAGWIVAAPGGAAAGGRRDVGSFANYSARGLRPLMSYGVAPVPSDSRRPGAIFARMLENGGAREFPASQVLALKWHQDPPIEGLTFPEYERIKGTEIEFLCDECDLELCFLPTDELAPRACFNHLRNTHDYQRAEAKAALDAQGIKNVAPFAIRREAQELERDERVKVVD